MTFDPQKFCAWWTVAAGVINVIHALVRKPTDGWSLLYLLVGIVVFAIGVIAI
jgi:uncharacterized membrane protein HdeD (DUF308 family)